ncbi:MAG: hypothetical protein ACQEXJ_07570 [Myxococcota bacterium]
MDDIADRTRPRRGASLASAFAVFLIICGLVLVALGGPATPERPPEPASAPAPAAAPPESRIPTEDSRKLQEAYEQMEQAEIALEAGNYGDVRGHLRRASGLVTHVLAESPLERP